MSYRATWGDVEPALAPIVSVAAAYIVANLDALPRRPNPVATSQPSLRGKHQIVDWTKNGDTIRRLCLACRPKSGAITTWRGRRIDLWQVRPQSYHSTETPGTIINIDDDGNPSVALLFGSLLIEQVLYRGRLIDSAGIRFRLGDRLGA